jgi:hypothetical protein
MPQRDVVNDRAWKRAFEDPILLPSGRKLVTLLDAARSGLARRNPPFMLLDHPRNRRPLTKLRHEKKSKNGLRKLRGGTVTNMQSC